MDDRRPGSRSHAAKLSRFSVAKGRKRSQEQQNIDVTTSSAPKCCLIWHPLNHHLKLRVFVSIDWVLIVLLIRHHRDYHRCLKYPLHCQLSPRTPRVLPLTQTAASGTP